MEYLDKLVALGLNVAYYRKLRLMTQEQLAEKAKISVSTIRKLENPNMLSGITFEMICRISDALDVPEYELLKFRG